VLGCPPFMGSVSASLPAPQSLPTPSFSTPPVITPLPSRPVTCWEESIGFLLVLPCVRLFASSVLSSLETNSSTCFFSVWVWVSTIVAVLVLLLLDVVGVVDVANM